MASHGRGRWGMLLLVAAAVAACGPQVVLVNKTGGILRFTVSSAGSSAVTTVAPGASVDLEVAETGPYTVGILKPEAWTQLLEAQRDNFAEKLLDPANLTPSEVAAIVANIDYLTTLIDDAIRNPVGASCSGTITSKLDGQATAITPASGAGIALGCTQVPAADPGFLDIPFIGSPF